MKVMRPVEREELASPSCDRCGFRCAVDDPEAQEFLEFDHTGAWASVFGDGMLVRIDLCQRCIQELLGPWLRIEEGPIPRQIEALAELARESTERAGARVDDALEAVAQSNARIHAMEDGGVESLKGMFAKPSVAVPVAEMRLDAATSSPMNVSAIGVVVERRKGAVAASIPDLLGAHAQGATLQEALRKLADVVEATDRPADRGNA